MAKYIKREQRKREEPIVLSDKGIFGICNCGGEIMFYSNKGVLCTRCGKLYGTWQYRRGRKNNPYELVGMEI
jgi:hypothetical protein